MKHTCQQEKNQFRRVQVGATEEGADAKKSDGSGNC